MLKLSMLTLGVTAAVIGCYGAFEQSAQVNGGYLVVAAPVVAGAAALIPYFAERAWQMGHRAKGLIFALILIPAAATVFFAAAERVHVAKAGAEAERAAQRYAIIRAEDALQVASRKATEAEAATMRWRAKSAKACDPVTCLGRWEAEARAARGREAEARAEVTRVQSIATEESPLKAPIWLLPASLDLVAFACIWVGLSIGSPVPAPARAPMPAPVHAKPKAKKARKPRAPRVALGRGLASFSVIEGGKS